MTTATTHSAPPGNVDALNTSLLFPSTNALGIPDLHPAPFASIPDYLLPYRVRSRQKGVTPEQIGVHFWLDDHRFETVWTRPRKALQALAGYKTLLTPDFSIYLNWPRAVQIWNVYRARWCGAFWQQAGYQVIPTVSWGIRAGYDFCFLGLPQNSVLALSTIGVDFTDPAIHTLFADGFNEMTKRLSPTALIVYGGIPDRFHDFVQVVTYPTRAGWVRLLPQKSQAVDRWSV